MCSSDLVQKIFCSLIYRTGDAFAPVRLLSEKLCPASCPPCAQAKKRRADSCSLPFENIARRSAHRLPAALLQHVCLLAPQTLALRLVQVRKTAITVDNPRLNGAHTTLRDALLRIRQFGVTVSFMALFHSRFKNSLVTPVSIKSHGKISSMERSRIV